MTTSMNTWNTRIFGMLLWGGAILLLSAPLQALAGETNLTGGRKTEDPLLSRFLSESDGPSGSSSQQALPSRFHLGFYPVAPPPNVENDRFPLLFFTFNRDQSSHAAIASPANPGYDSPHSAYRLTDIGRTPSSASVPGFAGLGESLLADHHQDDRITLSLGAGVRHDALSAGVAYARQSGPPAVEGGGSEGSSLFPSFLLTPLGGSQEQAFDGRSPDGHAVFLYMGHSLSQRLNLRGTLGLGKLTTVTNNKHLGLLEEQSSRWGVDFTASYRLLDNLMYKAHLGYVNIDDSSPFYNLRQQTTDSDATPFSSLSQGSKHMFRVGGHIRMTF